MQIPGFIWSLRICRICLLCPRGHPRHVYDCPRPILSHTAHSQFFPFSRKAFTVSIRRSVIDGIFFYHHFFLSGGIACDIPHGYFICRDVYRVLPLGRASILIHMEVIWTEALAVVIRAVRVKIYRKHMAGRRAAVVLAINPCSQHIIRRKLLGMTVKLPHLLQLHLLQRDLGIFHGKRKVRCIVAGLLCRRTGRYILLIKSDVAVCNINRLVGTCIRPILFDRKSINTVISSKIRSVIQAIISALHHDPIAFIIYKNQIVYDKIGVIIGVGR